MCSCSMHSCADPGKYDLWWHKGDQGTGGRDISQHGKIQQREKRDAALWRNQETGEPHEEVGWELSLSYQVLVNGLNPGVSVIGLS